MSNYTYADDLADLGDLGDEVVGALDIGALDVGDGEDEVGAFPFRRKRRRAAPAPRGRMVPVRRLIPRVPGVPAPGVGLQPLPLGTVTFTNTSGTLLQLQASPQKPFKGQRLVISQSRVGVSGGLVVVTRLEVGTANQFAFGGELPADAFAATAFDTNMSLQPATPGVQVTLLLRITAAPAAGDSVVVSAGLWGTVID